MLSCATFVLALGLPAVHGASVRASSSTVNMVQFFLKTPTADLPPEAVPDFLVVDPKVLPARLRDPYAAKRLELLALKKNADGRNKPPFRLMGKDPVSGCGPPERMSSEKLFAQMGFMEITELEEERLMQDTNCSECELRTEFTLTLIQTPPRKKGEKPRLHYFLNERDPITTLIAGYRANVKTTGTSFFGVGGSPKCR